MPTLTTPTVAEARPVTAQQRDKALEILDRMRLIVLNDGVQAGAYDHGLLNHELAEKSRKEAPCGGRRYCGIGAGLVAAGIYPQERAWSDGIGAWKHPGNYPGFLSRRPALRLVRDTLEEVAARYGVRMGTFDEARLAEWDTLDDGSIFENLIEGAGVFQDPQTGRPILLRMLTSARRQIEQAPVR